MENRVDIQIDGHIAIVKLNRPDKMNALDIAMFDAIIAAGKQCAANPAIRAVVLCGEGRAFCAGLDLGNFSPDNANSVTKEPLEKRTHGIANKWQKAVWVWRELPVPVIAAVHGVSFGGGLQIMLGADIKFVAPDTKLCVLEMKWGLIPDMAGTQLMRHNVRDDIIRELTYTHRVFSGEQAVAYGFATHTSDTPLDDAIQLAKEIASKSPSAVVMAKELLNKAPYLDQEAGLLEESILQDKIIGKKNQLEAVFAGLQKRDGQFDDFR